MWVTCGVVVGVWDSYVGYCSVVVGVWDSYVGYCSVVVGVWDSYVGYSSLMVGVWDSYVSYLWCSCSCLGHFTGCSGWCLGLLCGLL